MKCLARLNGFTLIETLVSLFILAFALLALAGLMVTTTKNNSFGGHMTEAATFAQDKLEELRATPWNNLVSFSGTDHREGSTKIIDYYSRTWSVDPNPPTLNDPLRTITVTVTWTDKTEHSIRLLSVLSH